jgi:purine-binding chemotaxis protein CheW
MSADAAAMSVGVPTARAMSGESARSALGAAGPDGRLPTTPDLHFVVFKLDGQRFGLPLARVERVLPMLAIRPLPGAPEVSLGAINVHGRIIPVLDLRRRLQLDPRAPDVGAHLILANTARRCVGLPVDEVLGVLEVAPELVHTADSVLPGLERLAGVASLPDGLLFIHDLDALLSLAEERALGAALTEEEA